MPLSKVCEFCGEEFKVKPSQINKKKYCSKECHNNSMKKIIKKICIYCEKEFIDNSSNRNKIYCSNKCKYEAQKSNIPYEIIYDLYMVKGMNTRDIGGELGVSKHKILDTLKYYNIPIRDAYTQRKGEVYTIPTKEELEKLYINKYMSYKEIGEIYKTDISNVGIWFKKYGIKPRKCGEGKKGKKFVMPTKKEIHNLYIDKKLTSAEIATIFHTTDTTICKIIKDYGFETRPNIWLGRKFIKCKDGHEVRSNLERIVDDYLYDNNIEHEYEKRLPNEAYRYMTDFYAKNTYIEIWGVQNSKSYEEKRKKKEKIYAKYNLKLISLEPQDFRELNILYKKLKKIS